MTVKRQLLNFNQRSVDVRTGSGAFDELPRIFGSAVGKPKRSLLVADARGFAARGEVVQRSLVDAQFSVETFAFDDASGVVDFSTVGTVLERCAGAGLTADDLVVGLGGAEVCSAVALAAQLWCGGTACALLPITLEGMETLATEMHPLAIHGVSGLVSVQPLPSMVVCDLDLVPSLSLDERLLGRVLMVGAALAEGKRLWGLLSDSAAGIAADEPLALSEVLGSLQLARRNVVKASNPSARKALAFGESTAEALADCLGSEIPRWALRSEGMRFEARLAVEAARLDPQVVFDQDDLFEDLGVEEYGFVLEAEALVEALKRVHARRSNRFLLPLPRLVGTVRLTAVPDDVLLRHASAYVASRAELLSGAQ